MGQRRNKRVGYDKAFEEKRWDTFVLSSYTIVPGGGALAMISTCSIFLNFF